MIAGSGGSGGGGGTTTATSLLKFQGANNSTDFIDTNTDNTWAIERGTPIISTTNPKFDSSCMSTSGNGGIITSLPKLQDTFTIEGWFRPESNTNDPRVIFGVLPGVAVYIYLNVFRIYTGSWSANYGTATINQYSHIVLESLNGEITFYVDGVGYNQSISSSVWEAPNPCQMFLGFRTGSDIGQDFIGKVGGFRVTNGEALYQGNFTPPTNQFT